MAWRWLERLYLTDDTILNLAIPKNLNPGDAFTNVHQTTEIDLTQYFDTIGDITNMPANATETHQNMYFKDGGSVEWWYESQYDNDCWQWKNPNNSNLAYNFHKHSANTIDFMLNDCIVAIAVDDELEEAYITPFWYYKNNSSAPDYRNRYVFELNYYRFDCAYGDSYKQKKFYITLGVASQPTPPVPPTPDTFTFYNFSKKVNSTKQPVSGTDITGHFRDVYNLLNPTIIIEADNEFPYNYVSWYDSANSLTRYYWIQNKAWIRNKLIEITLEEDMLATFKSSIGSMNAFVVRSASNFNPLITDTAWSTKNGIDLANATPVNQPFDVANGFYVVGIMEQSQGLANHNFARKGGVDYFACKDDELNELIEFLADKGATGEWADYRPIDRVVYLRFYPFNPGTPTSGTFQNALFQHEYNDGGTMREVEFTWDLHGYHGIVGTLVSGSGYVDFGNHPDAGNDKTYLNYMPYTEMELKAGPFGRIDLSKNLIDKDNIANRLDFTVTADLISGLAKLHIYSGQNLIYYTEDHSCTVDIAISAEFVNRYSDIQQRDFNKKQAVLQTASQAASAGGALVGAATFQNPLLLASGVALMANAIATQEKGKDQYIIDSYNMSIPQLSCRGTNGTWMKISENWRLITTYHRIAGDGGTILGRPKNDTVQISSCSGYLICNAASFEDSNAILTEVISINEYLNKGFYFE